MIKPKKSDKFKRVITFFLILSFVVSIIPALEINAIAAVNNGLDSWTWRNPLPQGNTLQEVTYVNGQFMAVGDHGTILSSSDGATWSSISSGTTSMLLGAAYGNGTFVVVGAEGTILKSNDGINWSSCPSGSSDNLYAVAYCNDIFVAVGHYGTILTSSDGINWSKRISGTSSDINAVTYGNGTFVAVGEEGTMIKSNDGINWSSCPLLTGRSLNGVIYANGIFVVVGGYGNIFISRNGANWTSKSIDTVDDFAAVTYSKGLFVAVGPWGVTATSKDGLSWSLGSAISSNYYEASDLKGVASYNGLFVAVGGFGTTLTSSDGLSWSSKTATRSHLSGATYGNGLFVTVGGTVVEGTILTSSDGINWTNRITEITDYLMSVTYGNGTFVAVGKGGTILTSSNGINWSKRASGTSSDIYAVTYGNGTFVAVGKGGTILTSDDSVNWSYRSSGLPGYQPQFNGVSYGNGIFIIVGDYGTILSSSDGINWSNSTSEITNNLKAVAYGNGTFVALGGGMVYTSPNGNKWSMRSIGSYCGVTYGNGIFVLVGYENEILISSDGFAWSPKSYPSYNDLFGVAYGNETFIVVGVDGTILQSGSVANVLPVTTFDISDKEISLSQYEAYDISYSIEPENATNKKVMWCSSDDKVARVVNGTIYPNKPGTAEITGKTLDGYYTDTCTVTVNPIGSIVPVTDLNIDKTKMYMQVGDVSKITATIEPSNSSNRNVMWTNGDHDDIATVDKNGNVTAKKAGVVIIEAAVSDGDNYFWKECSVYISDSLVHPTSISLDNEELNLSQNATAELSYTILPAETTNKDVQWSSSDENVATVVEGSVYTHNTGTAQITVTTSDGAISDSCKVNVTGSATNASTPNITAQPSNKTVNTGETATLSVEATGTGSLTYQWYCNTVNSILDSTKIDNATSSTYNAPTSSAGTLYYYCVVTNTDNSATGTKTAIKVSNVVSVIVSAVPGNAAAPTITSQPSSKTVIVGDSVTLSVNATGTGTLSYQWYSNTSNSTIGGSAISNATSPTYIAPTTTLGTTYYYCVITNTDNKVPGTKTATTTSNLAKVTVNNKDSNVICDNEELLALCQYSNSSLSINLSDPEKRKQIFGLLVNEDIKYKIYYDKIDESMLYQDEDIIYQNFASKLDIDFPANGKYILELYAGTLKKTVYVTVNVKDKSDSQHFGHIDFGNNEYVAIIPYEQIQRLKISDEKRQLLEQIKYCVENYSLEDWQAHLNDYKIYNKEFPSGSFSNYVDSIIRAQMVVCCDNLDAEDALRFKSSNELVDLACNISKQITGFDPDALEEAIQNVKQNPSDANTIALADTIYDTIDTVVGNADDFVNGTPKMSILDLYGIFDCVFKCIGNASEAYKLDCQANNLHNYKDIFYKEYAYLTDQKFPEISDNQWVEIKYNKDLLGHINIESTTICSDLSSAYFNSSSFVPCNTYVLNKQSSDSEASKDLLPVYPETFLYKYLTTKAIYNLHCPISVDIYYGDSIVATLDNTKETYIENEYGLFCSYYEGGELVKKIIMYNPDLKLVIKGTGEGTMSLSIVRPASSGLYETSSSVKDVAITASTVISTENFSETNTLSVDENGDGTADKQYVATVYEYPTSLSLTKSTISVTKGNSYQLGYSVLPANTAANVTTTWWSDDSNIASVDNTGLITAKSVGETDIHLSIGSGLVKACHVTVTTTSSYLGGGNQTDYSITFNTNGGSTVSTIIGVESGKTFTKPTDPTRDGYIFDGWYTDSALTNKYDFSKPITSNTTLYAKWIKVDTSNKFTDIESHQWASKAISYLSEKGIVNGIGESKFGPQLDIKRGDFILMLVRAFDLKADCKVAFSDVPTDSYYYNAINIAKELGVAKGNGNEFEPNSKLSRQDAMVLISRVIALKGITLKAKNDVSLTNYTDVDQISAYAKDSVSVLIKAGIIQGDGTNLHPLEEITRAEMVVMLYKVLTAVN